MSALDVLPLGPAPSEFRLDRLITEPARLRIVAVARRPVVACPVCGHLAHRVHSHYERRLADLPWHGLAVTLHLVVRRFVCETPDCRRRIFCERVPRTAVTYARRTGRLTTVLEVLGLTSGGEAGARLAATLGMATSPDTLLRVAKSAPLGSDLGEPIRVLGVDDWAWRRGQRYGTILVDLERGRVVDLLPTREPEPLIAWLQTHPEVAIVSRDRASGYADAVRRGAPAAIQVADRFHLLRNLTEALERTLERHQPVLRTVAPPASSLSTSTMAPARRRVGPVAQRAPQPRLAERRQAATRERRQARYEQVVSLHARGLSQLAIRRLVGVSRGTVIRWLTCGRFPERRPRSPRPTTLSEHAAYLRMRWAEGCHNASRLWRELRATRNFRGGQTTVRDWIQQHLRAGAPADAMPPPRHRPPRGSPRQTAWLLSAPADRLTESERAYLDALSQACPAIAMARALAAEFRRILREHDVNAFMPWLAAAEQSDLRSLATGLRRDRDAVLAAILLRWSNGPVEGHVHRLKLIKRTMYGRAGFPLLRQRVLAA